MEWTRGRTIGRGSTATVSLATSSPTGKLFAVKFTELSNSEFLQREQRIMSSLCSPYVVGYQGYGVSKESSCLFFNIFLEYMPGGSLSDMIRCQGGHLDEPTIRCFTNQILKGLDYLHSNGVVHCDIKSRNILIGADGAKIADFGCAKLIDAVASVAGTPLYMAPEVARGDEQGFACDIWSMGCTIIEMATGGAPWRDLTDPVSVLYRVGYSDQMPELPCFLSSQGKDFLEKCTRRDPDKRWTARQLLSHPFLQGERERIEEFPSCTPSSSPTSILDQAFWNDIDETQSTAAAFQGESIRSIPPRGKLGSLATSLVHNCSSWDHEDGDWITVREDHNCSCSERIHEQESAATAGSCGEVFDKKFTSSIYYLNSCTYSDFNSVPIGCSATSRTMQYSSGEKSKLESLIGFASAT